MSWWTMKVSAEIEKIPSFDTETRRCATRKNKRHNMATSKRINILVLLVILIFGQLCTTSARHVNSGPSSWTLSRKARGFRTVSVHAAATLSPSELQAVYSNDKRLIHTGPNPLHN